MDELIVTRTLEGWSNHQLRVAVVRDLSMPIAVLIAIGALALGFWLWVPQARFLVWLCGAGGAAALGWGVLRIRALRATPQDLARRLDDRADAHDLLQTAMAVEARRAVGGDAAQREVRERARALLPTLSEIGRPPIEVPLLPIALTAIAGLFATLVIALALVLPVLPVSAPTSGSGLPRVASGLADEVREDLVAAVEDLQALAREPGLDPAAKAAVERARDAAGSALSHLDDAQRAAGELDRARTAITQAQRGPYRSASALAAARSNTITDAMDLALQRSDTAAARRLADEVLRRVESERSEGELRRLGRQLAERDRPPGAAGYAMERAGQKLAAGDRGGALSALADLMAELGEPVEYIEHPPELRSAAEAIERARARALEQLESADRAKEGEGAGTSQERADGPAAAPGEGATPSPVDLPQGARPEDPGGGPEDGGDKDLAPGGSPTPGEPRVNVDAPDPDAPRLEAEGQGARTAQGEGEAMGDGPMDGSGGLGDGAPEGEGQAGQGEGASGSMTASGGAPGQGAGQGEGTGAFVDLPATGLADDVVDSEWVESQWSASPERMGELMRGAEAGGRSSLPWSEVHARYESIAESASRRQRVPMSRRSYIQTYFEAIRPELDPETP